MKDRQPRIRIELNWWSAVPSHPLALPLSAFAADTAAHIRGVGAVLEVVPAAGRQSGLKCAGPLLVGPGETQHLVGGQAKFTEHRPERLAAVDRVEELLPQLTGSRLAPASARAPWRRRSGLRGIGRNRSLPASGSRCRGRPEGRGGDPGDRSGRGSDAAARESKGAQGSAERAPASDDRRRHIAHGGRLANRGDHLLSIHRTNASGSPLAFA